MNRTSIEWTHRPQTGGAAGGFTWNPIRARNKESGKKGTFCTRISGGCQQCYASTINKRFGTGLEYTVPNLEKHEFYLDERILAEPLKRKPATIFVGDMFDLFHEAIPDEFIDAVLVIAMLAPWHTYQLLTKRASRLAEYFRRYPFADGAFELKGTELRVFRRMVENLKSTPADILNRAAEWLDKKYPETEGEGFMREWPLPNLWLGVSVESQKYADERIPLLLQTPAAVRFLSVEPLLEAIDISKFLRSDDSDNLNQEALNTHGQTGNGIATCQAEAGGLASSPSKICMEAGRKRNVRCARIHWCIVGGESGPGARPFNLRWAESLQEQCKKAGTAFFLKQLGSVPMEEESRWRNRNTTRLLSAKNRGKVPGGFVSLAMRDRKGGDMSEWPEHLRVREFPR